MKSSLPSRSIMGKGVGGALLMVSSTYRLHAGVLKAGLARNSSFSRTVDPRSRRTSKGPNYRGLNLGRG